MRLPGPGDHPVSDLIFHGLHPFPEPVERLILKIHEVNPRVWREFAGADEGWTRMRFSEESCLRVLDFLSQILRDLDDRGRKGH